MISRTGFIHISVIAAIAAIGIVEIRFGRDTTAWLAIFTAIIGYILPQPTLRKKKILTPSMLHLSPDFETNREPGAQDIVLVEELRRSQEERNEPPQRPRRTAWKGDFRLLIEDVWPSVVMLSAVVIWGIINIMYGQSVHLERDGENITIDKNIARQLEEPPTIKICKFLTNQGKIKLCDPSHQEKSIFGVEIFDGWLSICSSKETGATMAFVQLDNGEHLVVDRHGWNMLLFRMPRIIQSMHRDNCYKLSIGYRNETVVSCNDKVKVFGCPTEITFTSEQFNALVHRLWDIQWALINCR
jgi:hypothetical protein